MHLGRITSSIIIVAGLALLFSCSGSQQIQLNTDGSGQMELDINLNPVLRDYLLDLLDSFSTDDQIVLFDIPSIEAALIEEPLIQLTEIASNGYDYLKARFSFRNLDQMLSESVFNMDKYITLETVGARRRLEFSLSQESLLALIDAIPVIDKDSLLYLLPIAGEMSREEYKESLLWSLEEYGPAEEIEGILDEAFFRLDLYTPQGFSRVSDGINLDGTGRRAVLTLPLLDLLLADVGDLYFLEY